MITLLKNWKGSIEINDTKFETVQDAMDFIKDSTPDSIVIKLSSAHETSVPESKPSTPASAITNETEYFIKVKQYMTKPATPDFDFMAQWNDNVPMPMRYMKGRKIRETRGMVYMDLHGDMLQKIMPTCMKCGKPITNPVSQFFGMGPECGGHNYVNPFNTEEELAQAVEAYKIKLQNVKWSGWIVKSAIEEEIICQ